MRWSTVPGGHGRVSLKRYGRPKQLVVCTQPLNTILSGPTDMEALVRDEGDCYHTTPMPGRIGPKKRIDSYECQDKENTAPLQAGASNVKATAAKVTPSRLDRINDLKEELTCSICLELCTRPCTVPCGFPLKINTALWNTIQLLFPSTVQNACADPATPEAVLQAALDLMPAAMPAAALRTRLPESLANPFRQPRAGGVASQARHAVPATSHMWQPEMALRPHGVTGNGLASAAGSGALVGTGAGGAGLTQGAAARNRIVEQHPPPSRLESLLHTVQLPTVRQTLTQPATQRQPRPLHHQTDSSQPANMNNPFARQASTASQRPLMQLGPSADTLQQLSGHRLDEDLPATLRMQPDTEVIELSSDAEQGSESDSEHDGFTTASDSGSEGSEARPDDDDLGLGRTIRRLTDMSLQVTPAPGSTLRQAAARAMAGLLPQSTPGVPVTPLALHTQLAHVAHQPQDASPQFMVPATSGSHLLGWQPGADSASSDEDMVPGTTQGLAEAAASIGRQARSPFSPVLQLLASTMAMGSNARPSTSHVVASPLWQNAHGTAGAPLTLAAVPEVYLQPEHLPDTSSDQSCHRAQQLRQATRTPSASTPMHSSRGTSRSGTHSPQLLAANDLHHHLRDQHDPPYQAARVADDPPPAAHQLPASPQPDPLSPTGLGTLAASAFTPMVQSMQAAGEVAAQGTPSSATGAATAHPAGQEGVSAARAPSSSQEWEGAGLPCSSAAGYAAWRRPSAASTLPSQLDDSDSSGSLEIVEAAAAAAQSGSVCHGGGLTQELASWGATAAAALVESSEHDDMIGSMGQLSMCSDPSQPTPAVQVFGDTIAAAGTGQQRQALLRAARARTAAAGAEIGSAAGEQPGLAAAANLQGSRPPNPPLAEHQLHSGTSAVPASAEGAQQRGPPAPSGLTVPAAAVAAAGPDQEARRSPEGTAADMITLLSSSDDLSEQLPTRSRRSQRGSQARRQEFQLGTAAQQQVPQQQAQQQQQGVHQEQAAGPGPVIDLLVALLVLIANGGQSLQALIAAQFQGALHAIPNALEVHAPVGVPVQPPAPWGGLGWWDWASKRTKAGRANRARQLALVAAAQQQQVLMSAATEAAADTEAELEEARSQLRSCQSVNMRTATDLQECREQLHQSQQALQQSESEVLALQVSLHRYRSELSAAKQELAACKGKVRSMGTQLAAMRAQLATAKRAMPKDVRDKMSWLQRNEVSLYTLKRWHAMWGAPPCTQAASPATAMQVPPPPCHKERDSVTGAYTAAYACSNAALLTLPNVSCQQLGPLRTAVAAAEFPDAPPQPQAGPSTVRRHQLMLTCDIQRTFEAWGKAEDRGRQGLSAEVAFGIERLCSLIMGHWDGLPNMGVWHKPSFPTLTRWGSFVTACLSLTRVLGPVTKAVAIIMEERGALAPDWAAELSGLLLNTTFTFQVMVVAVVGQQIIMPELGWAATGGGMHAFEVARHVEALSDSLLGALVDQDFPEIFSRAQELVPPAQWEVVKLELVHLITQHIDAMFKYLGAHSKVYLQLPHLLPAMASSDATYAAHAARRVLEEDAANRKQWEAWEEQQQEEERQQDHGNRKRMRRPLPPQSCNPAEYDPFNTISMFRADIEAMAANEACSPRLFMHLVHFFGAAPTSNAHVESALQHAKHGHGSKQGLAALLGTVIAKTDPASFRDMDAVDLQPRMKALRKEQRDMERASAAKTAVARAARKAVTESCMVGGNKQLVLNIGTVASLGRLRAASSRHPRGADYSATTLEEAAAFTLAQLWGYINFYKIPPKHRPAQKTLLQIEQRTKAALSSGPGGVA
ncbi:hypothetical protein QJQ45_027815 [Haematococcus lacustris]|nr:hypothetical protein QJQ45_027815 [Haematococcus lacustris]